MEDEGGHEEITGEEIDRDYDQYRDSRAEEEFGRYLAWLSKQNVGNVVVIILL